MRSAPAFTVTVALLVSCQISEEHRGTLYPPCEPFDEAFDNSAIRECANDPDAVAYLERIPEYPDPLCRYDPQKHESFTSVRIGLHRNGSIRCLSFFDTVSQQHGEFLLDCLAEIAPFSPIPPSAQCLVNIPILPRFPPE